jgi:Dolichyl-phosphate-mannose-protein mannosyltransferase
MISISADSAPARSAHIVLAICAIAGGALLFFSTSHGVGLSPDSAVYVGAARSLLQGHGYSMPTDAGTFAPVVHFPPLYSISLSLLSWLGQDPFTAARWLNILLLTASAFLAGLIAFPATASRVLSGSAVALIMTSYPVVHVHTMAWSEPLFIFFQLAGVFFLLRFFWQAEQFNLIAAATATGLSILSRYAGFASVVAGWAAILWLYEKPLRQKFRAGAIFLAVSLTPVTFWLVRNQWTTGSGTNRRLAFHLLGLDHLNVAVEAVVSWFSGFGEAPTEAKVLAAGLGLFGAFAWWRMGRDRAPVAATELCRRSWQVVCLSALTVVTYLCLLFVSISLLDYYTPLDSRIFSPAYAMVVLTGISLALSVGQQTQRHKLLAASAGIALFFVALQVPRTWIWLDFVRREGVGYNARVWAQSALLNRLREVDPATKLFSNAPDLIYTLLGRSSGTIPSKVYPDTHMSNPEFDVQLTKMQETLLVNKGLLIIFDRVNWRWYLPTAKELESRIPLIAIARTDDGVIYRPREN